MNKITKKLFSNLDQIDFDKVLSVDLWDQEYLKRETIKQKIFSFKLKKSAIGMFKLIKFFFKTLYLSLNFYPALKAVNKNVNNIFYLRSSPRSDIIKHSQFYENLDSTTLCILNQRIKKFSIAPLIYSILIIYKSRKLWNEVFKKNSINFFSLAGLNITLKLFNSFQDTLKILPDLLTHSKLVSFLEMARSENIICQVANIYNLETFSLEHNVGMYKDYGNFWEKYPILHYKNSVCKKVLCWGNYSKNFYKKHTDAKIYIIGKAILSEEKKYSEGIIFLFNSKRFSDANNKLLNISNKFENNKIPVSRWFKDENLIKKNGDRREGPLRKIVIGFSTN